MRRRILTALSLALTAALLSGCGALLLAGLANSASTRYTKEEEKSLVEKGRTVMQEYLRREVPGFSIVSAEARTERMIGQGTPTYLSEYVHGEYLEPGEPSGRTFEVNTETGEIFTDEHYGELKALLLGELTARLDPSLEYESVELTCSKVILPHHCGTIGHKETAFRHFEECGRNGGYGLDSIQFGDVLPAGLTDVEAYLEDADARGTLYAGLRITVADGFDFESIDPASILRERNGIVLETLDVRNSSGRVSVEPCGVPADGPGCFAASPT